jgi:glycosyltransferase involved in cell wall biosynthesis
MNQAPSLSVVIPAYREAENILSTLENVIRALSPLAIPHEILVVDDGSDDGTGTIVAQQLPRLPAVRLLANTRNMGFGWSYRRGVDAAACDHIVMVHGDNAWGAETLRNFFSHLGEADVIVGYTRDMWRSRSWRRTIVSKSFTHLVNLITRRRLQYYNGLQIHQAAVLRNLRIESRGYGFQAEVLVKALRAGATYREIPMDLIERAHGESQAFRLKNVADVARTLALLFTLQRTPASGASPAREVGL